MASTLRARLPIWFPSPEINSTLENRANLFALSEQLLATRHRYYVCLFVLLGTLAVAKILRHSFLRAKPRIDVPVLNLENTSHDPAAKKWMYNYEELLHAGYKRVSVIKRSAHLHMLIFVHSSSMRCINFGRRMDS